MLEDRHLPLVISSVSSLTAGILSATPNTSLLNLSHSHCSLLTRSDQDPSQSPDTLSKSLITPKHRGTISSRSHRLIYLMHHDMGKDQAGLKFSDGGNIFSSPSAADCSCFRLCNCSVSARHPLLNVSLISQDCFECH